MPDSDNDDGDIKDLPRYIVPEPGPRVSGEPLIGRLKIVGSTPDGQLLGRVVPVGLMPKPDTCAEPLPIDVPTPGKIMEDEVPFPATDSLWRHVGTGGIYRVVEECAARLPGGMWRHGGVAYRAVAGGKLYWRDLASWRQSMVLHTPENNPQDSG